MPESKFSKNLIKLMSAECPGTVYYTRKNKRQIEKKIELKKYCPRTRKHVLFTEARKLSSKAKTAKKPKADTPKKKKAASKKKTSKK